MAKNKSQKAKGSKQARVAQSEASPPPQLSFREHLDKYAERYVLGFIALYAIFGLATVSFFPTYSWPNGDEGTYLSYALHPWTLTSDLFEGYRPKEMQSQFAARVFLNPFSLVFAVFGFTYVGARIVVLIWGLILLWLVFRIGERIGSRVNAMLATVLVGLSPPFVYFTHGIRPEGMFTMFLALCTWIIIQRKDGPTPRTYAALAFVSSAMLGIHYNGALMPPLFFAMIWFYDRKNFTLKKFGAYVAGGLAFVVLFMLTTFLPALDTVREYGIRPVTFISESKIPILTYEVWQLWERAYENWEFQFGENNWTDSLRRVLPPPLDHPSETRYCWVAMVLPALYGIWRCGRVARMLGVYFAVMFVYLNLIFPNTRQEYLLYIKPFVLLLGMQGLAALPRLPWLSTLVAFVTIGMAYLIVDVQAVHRFAKAAPQNRRTVTALRDLAARVNPDLSKVTVMGPQEFHAGLHETRYRTFHSALRNKTGAFPYGDLAVALEVVDPDIVILTERMLAWIADQTNALIGAPPGRDPQVAAIQQAQLNKYMRDRFQAAGMHLHTGTQLYWGPIGILRHQRNLPEHNVQIWLKRR